MLYIGYTIYTIPYIQLHYILYDVCYMRQRIHYTLYAIHKYIIHYTLYDACMLYEAEDTLYPICYTQINYTIYPI